jgi:hypothetical protein
VILINEKNYLSSSFFMSDHFRAYFVPQVIKSPSAGRPRIRCRYLRRNAQAHAKAHGVSANTRFEVGLAKDYPGKDFDLVTCFDCLHDMGDPAGASATSDSPLSRTAPG